jgi:hypothetical protein
VAREQALAEQVARVRGSETRAQQWSAEVRGQETRAQQSVTREQRAALEAWLAMQERSEHSANDDVIGTLRYTRDEAARESRFHDAHDEAFASCAGGPLLSPFQGLAARGGT